MACPPRLQLPQQRHHLGRGTQQSGIGPTLKSTRLLDSDSLMIHSVMIELLDQVHDDGCMLDPVLDDGC